MITLRRAIAVTIRPSPPMAEVCHFVAGWSFLRS
jgi:hypothetical protein